MKITKSDVNVNIKEIKKPELNSNLVAENIAQQLVKRVAYRGNEKSNAISHEIECQGNKGNGQWKTCRKWDS